MKIDQNLHQEKYEYWPYQYNFQSTGNDDQSVQHNGRKPNNVSIEQDVAPNNQSKKVLTQIHCHLVPTIQL